MFPLSVLSAYQRFKSQHEVYSKQNKHSLQTRTGKDNGIFYTKTSYHRPQEPVVGVLSE